MPVSFNGLYTQNFDTLATSNSSTNTTTSVWANDSTISGWSLFNKNNTAITTYIANNGGTNSGSFYSFGALSNNDRALGGVGSGGSYFGSPANPAVAGWITFSATNSSASTINSLSVAFNGEQWRDGGATTPNAQSMVFQYGFGTSFTAVSNWNTPGGSFNWASPVFTNTGTGAAVDGNAAGRVNGLGGSLNSLNWAVGSTLWFRWIENNDAGNDHGLAIDDFSLTATATPTGSVTITQTGGSTDVTEGGTTDTYTVVLNSQPTADVTININNGTDTQTKTAVSTTSLVFTSANWNVPQTVTVTAINDGLVEGTQTNTITHTTTSTDFNYNSITVPSVVANITDNDSTTSTIRITEYLYTTVGTPAREFVELTNVTNAAIDLTGWSFDDNTRTAGSFSLSGFSTVAPGESVIITETTAADFRTNWSLPSSVKVIGGSTENLGRADEINIYNDSGILVDRLTYDDQTIPSSIRTQGFSGWTTLANLGKNDITKWQLSVVNDAQNSYSASGDVANPGIYNVAPGVAIIQSSGSTDIAEGGATDTYTIVLKTQPSANVNIAINGGSQTTPNPTNLTFTTANWNIPQTVTVTAIDDTVVEGNHTGTISHSATSSDTNYNNIAIGSVVANITDNDSVNNPPAIVLNTTSTTNFLDGGAASSPTSGNLYISGVIGDPTDPASTSGLVFTVSDAETSATSLMVTASSNNTAVVSNANLALTGTGADRTLKITPTGVGTAVITVNVNDGTNNTTYNINYAASAASTTPSTSRFLTGASNASTAVVIDSNYMLVGDDEDQKLRLYDRNNSGLPLTSFDYTASLGLTDTSGGIPREVDIEASTRVGNRIYWMGSQSNSDTGSSRPNRDRVFATDITGTGANTTLSYVGRYDFLEEDIIAWDTNNSHGKGANYYGLAASSAAGVGSKQSNGYNIEGLEMAPDNSTAYIAFRAPQVTPNSRTNALIIPVTNFTSLLGKTIGNATFGAPIELDLGGRGIREIRKNAANQYVIIAGFAGDATGIEPADFRLYTWNGVATEAPVMRLADLTALNADGSFESIVEVPTSLTSTSQIQLLLDNGTTIYYNNGLDAKSVNANFQKSRSEVVTLGGSITKISAIQGTGSSAALTGTQTIEGIVVGDFQGTNQLGGFYLQEEDTDADGNVLTSEGIFVNSLVAVNVGDKVRVTGTVTENNSTPSFNQAVITPGTTSDVTVLATGQQALVTPTVVNLPTTVLGDLERYEGMLVTLPQTLTVTEVFNLGRFGEISLSANGRLSNPTNIVDPNDNPASGTNSTGASNVAAVTAQQDLNNRSRIILDDGSSAFNLSDVPYIDTTDANPLNDTLRIGSTIAGLTGVLGYGFNNYRIQATQAPTINYEARPTLPTVGGSIKVGSFNVLNYFNGDGLGGGFPTSRGADSANEFSRQRAKIIAAIQQLNADVVGLIEMENDGDGANSAIADLVNGLNTAIGTTTYAFIPLANTTGSPGTDEIKVAFIYKPSALTPIGNAVYFNDTAFSSARPPLAQTFSVNATGEKFTPIINHFKSKGSSAGLAGDTDQGDGQGLSNATRKAQATALLNFVSQIQTASGDSDVVILGDLNAYNEEDPIDILRAGGFTKLTTATDSYVFDGQTGSLDHALVTSSLLNQVTGAAKWNINSSEPIALDYNDTVQSSGEAVSELRNDTSLYSANPFRSSDHDPVLVGLNLRPTNNAPAIITTTNLAFDTNPFDLNGWLFGTSVLQNPPSPFPVVVGNQASLNTTTGSAIQAGFFRNDQTLDRTVGYTVNFSAKILAEAREASANKNNDGLDDRAGFSVIATGNDLNGLEIGFFSDRIWVQQDGVAPNLFTQAESVSFDATKQATYTLTVLDNKYTLQAKEIGGTNATATLYGRLRNYSTSGATVTLNGQTVSPYAIPNFIFFGDDTTSARASFNLSNISVSNGATAIALPSLAENSANNTVVGTIQAIDIDGNAIAYSITSGNTNGAFAINNNGQVIIAHSAAIDFETNPNFNLTVQVSDGTLTDTATVAIALANVNEAPTITSGASVSFAENGTETVYTAMATDPDAGQTATLVYSLSGADAALFNINSNTGAITFKNAPNFEAPTDIGINNVYDINAIASDGSLSNSKAVAITVTNINEAPIVSNAIASQLVDTKATFNFALPNNIFTDPEGDNLIYSAITPGWLSFTPATKTFTGSAPNTVGTNAITVQVNDGNGNTNSTNFNIFVKAATVVGNVGNGTSLVDYSTNTIGISIVTGEIAETIKGGSGADKIQGAGGNDIIFGNAGNDRLYGEAGDDTLYGGLGTDNLWGGLGSDTFVLQSGQGLDIANDFLPGTDKLGLSGGLTFGIGNNTTDVTSALFGTATKVFAPGGVELMRLLNFAGTLTASDFTTVV